MPKRVNFFRLLLLPTVALALWPGPSRAIVITTTVDKSFSPSEREVINQGVAAWTQYFAEGGPNVHLTFVADDNLSKKDPGTLGFTRGSERDGERRKKPSDQSR